MTKKNRTKKRSANRKIPLRSQPQAQRTGAIQSFSRLKGFIPFCVAVIGIGGTCATLYGLRPQPVVVSTVSLNDENPFDSQFSIINGGSLDMQDVRFVCFMKSIKTTPLSIDNSLANIAKFPKISAGDTVTLPAFKAQIPSSIITDADIAIVVKYRPSFYPWRLKRVFRLVTAKAQPKGFKWLQQPVDEAFIEALKRAEFAHRDRILKGGWD